MSALKGEIWQHWHKKVEGARNMSKPFYKVGRKNMQICIMAMNTTRNEATTKHSIQVS